MLFFAFRADACYICFMCCVVLEYPFTTNDEIYKNNMYSLDYEEIIHFKIGICLTNGIASSFSYI